MSHRRRHFLAVIFLCTAASMLRAEVPVAGSLEKPPTKPAAENPCLKYLPDDTFVLGNVDLKTIVKWVNAEKNPNAGILMLKQYLAAGQIITGIDPETEVDYITIFVTGNPDKEPKFLVAISGTFTTAAVEKQLSDQFTEAEISRVGGKNLYTLTNGAFALPEGGTLLLGSPDLVKAAMGKAKGKFEPPAGLKATLSQTDADTAIWLAVKPKSLIELKELEGFRKENVDLAGKLSALDFVAISVSAMKDGYHLSATTALADKEKAAALAEYLAGRKKALLNTEGVNAFYLPLLLASEIETKDANIRTTLRLTQAALKEIWDTKVILKR